MTDKEIIDSQTYGFEMLCTYSRMIAILPLEDWLAALNHAETVGPILDPTLYREYLGSPNPEILKSLIEAAIPLKRAVLKAQPALEKIINESP